MKISVIIPSYQREEKLRRCLDGLSRQRFDEFEVLVGLDGGDEDTAAAITSEYSRRIRRIRVIAFEKLGYIPVRNRLLGEATGRLFLSLNDDIRPDAGLLGAHWSAHDRCGGLAAVTGPSHWVRPEDPNAFDGLVARSGLIFFEPTPDTLGRVGFRDCYGLNFSAPTDAARAIGGFHEITHAYGYDDIEFAFRLAASGAEIVYEPTARVEHDHRYRPGDVMKREYRLGQAAWSYAEVSRDFCRAVFGADITNPGYLDDCEAYIRMTERDADRICDSFISLERFPESMLGDGDAIPRILAEHWVLLKRRLWRQGLIDAARGSASQEVDRIGVAVGSSA